MRPLRHLVLLFLLVAVLPAEAGRTCRSPYRALDAEVRSDLEKHFTPSQLKNLQRMASGRMYLIVRLGNPDSLRYQSEDPRRFTPKPAGCPLKSATTGDYSGLVVRPKKGAFATEAQLTAAKELWRKRWPALRDAGYRVDASGRVVDPLGRLLYSDYDLHGAYDLQGKLISYGNGSTTNPIDESRLEELNRRVNPGLRLFQHGALDEWGDPAKKAQPPVVAFSPNDPPVVLRTVEEMQAYYLRHGLPWSYGSLVSR